MSNKTRVGSLLAAIVLALGIAAAPAFGAVKIKKIAFDPPGTDTGTNRHLNKELVVIKNAGSRQRSIDRWRLHDRARDHVFRFVDVVLAARDLVKLHSGRGQHRVTTGCGGDCTVHHYYWGLDNYVWNNDGDVATLRNRSRNVVDRCRYGSSADSPKRC